MGSQKTHRIDQELAEAKERLRTAASRGVSAEKLMEIVRRYPYTALLASFASGILFSQMTKENRLALTGAAGPRYRALRSRFVEGAECDGRGLVEIRPVIDGS